VSSPVSCGQRIVEELFDCGDRLFRCLEALGVYPRGIPLVVVELSVWHSTLTVSGTSCHLLVDLRQWWIEPKVAFASWKYVKILQSAAKCLQPGLIRQHASLGHERDSRSDVGCALLDRFRDLCINRRMS
jgi:hypothetical protein